MIACGALGAHIREIVDRRGWAVELHFLPSLLHNRPERITPAAEEIARAAQARGLRVALAYADCGTYGALDDLCSRLGLRRLPGLHCYDVLAGPDRLRALFDAEPGTYVLTDFLVRGFRRLVVAELGLDQHPELWPDYFGHYRRVVWLAQDRSADLEAAAAQVAGMFGLPLTVIDTGTGGLERELELLLAPVPAPPRSWTERVAGTTQSVRDRKPTPAEQPPTPATPRPTEVAGVGLAEGAGRCAEG